MSKTRKRKRKGKQELKIVKLDSLKQINLNAAGLDIGAEEIWVCVPEERDRESVRAFGTFTPDLHAIADWLEQCGVTTVAMESTGVYWIPVYEILEERGFEVYLVNAQHIKNVPGKKTDVLDCQWIQQLHTYGLLRGSFRPPEEMCALRGYVRHRGNLIRYRSAHIQHMQKALHQMNVQLTQVLSDITGVTGMKIMRAIVAGDRDPVALARFRDARCAHNEEEIAKALTGNYRAEHVFALRQALELYDFYTTRIQLCDVEIEQHYSAIRPEFAEELPALPAAPKSRGKPGNAPNFDLRSCLYQLTGVDLTAVDGLDSVLVQKIITEIGTDMSKWPTVKHFTSWLRLAPHNEVSGGKLLKSKTGKTSNRAAAAFRMAAQAVARSDSGSGAFYRRIRAKRGAPKAIVATAHRIARIVYHMLKYREAYVDPGATHYEEQHRQRAIRNLKRKAAKLGMKVVSVS